MLSRSRSEITVITRLPSRDFPKLALSCLERDVEEGCSPNCQTCRPGKRSLSGANAAAPMTLVSQSHFSLRSHKRAKAETFRVYCHAQQNQPL